ncbi:MAG: hypothetical protein HY074_03495, partial [Deltaproteobacteria bacterium]|nr:hypothetical protein [Deltaproteobacteria bacterium]
PVVIFIPLHFRAHKRVDVILHLHGWVEDGETIDDTIRKFKFAEVLGDSRRNAILVVPRSSGHCETFKKQLTHFHVFNNFMDHVLRLLVDVRLAESLELGDLTLTGHSGSYSTLEAIVSHKCESAPRSGCYAGHVKELFLFDCLYDSGEGFVKFAKESPPFRFASVFIPLKKKNGDWKWTAAGNHALWSALNPNADDSTFLASTLAPDTSPEQIAQAAAKGPTFMQSDVGHDMTFNKYFPRLLRAVHHQGAK